ncbi:MAG: hypothetical protein JRH15_18880, partial [Deltaproteobacteria bacterium]|nr:hypothetical protein [Deltaproteobacteria bacterium]
MLRRNPCCMIMALVAVCLVHATAFAASVEDPLDRPAVMSRGAAHSVLLDVTTAGERLVAVGERGIVVLSDDAGHTWRQAKVPT